MASPDKTANRRVMNAVEVRFISYSVQGQRLYC